MASLIDAATLKNWLADGGEIALVDVREHGQFGEGHPFFAVSAPFSRFETTITGLVPNPRVRLVLVDAGDGVAGRAAARAAGLGFERVHILDGGAGAWARAGYTLFAGVNVPSKAFGELVELERATPHVTARELRDMVDAGEDLVIVDGRPFEEYRRMSIPGGICCPNGELALHIAAIAPDPRTRIVVNCAGRTRSIIGAQTLIDLGVRNPVSALENGTQGWFLAGLELETGASRAPAGDAAQPSKERRERARRLGLNRGVGFVAADEVAGWLGEEDRTTYLIDVRTPEETSADGVDGFIHAPGGQLVQGTDRWIGVRGARVVLADSEEVRAPVIAAWLRQMGHEAHVLTGGIAAARASGVGRRLPVPTPATPDEVSADELARIVREGSARIIDLRPSMDFRDGHIAGSIWSIRPRIAGEVAAPARPVVLIANEADTAALAAIDLAEGGITDMRFHTGGPLDWIVAGIEVAASPGEPADEACIDFLFFTHARHLGDAEAARQYLAWETALIGQLDAQERGSIRIAPPD